MYIYTMEYYAAEKNNDIMKFAGKWMELENVILSELWTLSANDMDDDSVDLIDSDELLDPEDSKKPDPVS
ncbi:hypothetical protein STEG23_035925 [Scotinomys teguina]